MVKSWRERPTLRLGGKDQRGFHPMPYDRRLFNADEHARISRLKFTAFKRRQWLYGISPAVIAEDQHRWYEYPVGIGLQSIHP